MGLLNTANKTNTIDIKISSLDVNVMGEIELLKNIWEKLWRYPLLRIQEASDKIREKLESYGPEILFFPNKVKEFITNEICTEKTYAKHGNQHWTLRYIRHVNKGSDEIVGITIMDPSNRVSISFMVEVDCDPDVLSDIIGLTGYYNIYSL